MRGHTDACSFPFTHEFQEKFGLSPSPDFVMLICYRNPDRVPTCVAPLSKILQALSEAAIGELQQSIYSIRTQGSFFVEHALLGVPVITVHPQFGYQIRYSHSNVVAPGDDAKNAAITELEEHAIPACLVDVLMSPGDLLLINNRTALHGRRKVGDNTGPSSRWLQRVYAQLSESPKLLVDPRVPYMLRP